MEGNKGKGEYEVLSPVAEIDPVPIKGISPRMTDLAGKTIGLFDNGKVAASPIRDVVERRLKEKYSGLKFTRFVFKEHIAVIETKEKARFEEWLKGVDTVIAAVGD